MYPAIALCLLLSVQTRPAVHWQHPAGFVTSETLSDMRVKLETQEWARRTLRAKETALQPWLDMDAPGLRRVFPTRRGNVYHNFSCPKDRRRLTFNPFRPERFACPSCGAEYAPESDPGIYPPGDRYHGTMYDGWACLFYLEASGVAEAMGILGRLQNRPDFVARGIDILMCFADTLEGIPTRPDPDPQMRVILTYHREGDNKVLNDLAVAYELLREHMDPPRQARFEQVVLRRMLDDIMLEPIYTYNHNNLYQWHRTIVQTALALEREDLIDWSFGYGAFSPDRQPEHRSIRRLAATHFKPDGAYWEMCSGYHLYPVFFFCELAVVSRTLSRMDPARFPAESYDLTHAANPAAQVIKNALEWFLSMAPPDRIMPTIGDSMAPKAGMTDYYAAAEAGYRFFDVRGIGDYDTLREGNRTWDALLYGSPDIVRHQTAYTSSYLSSGWLSLRNEWKGNRVWIGLNALIPGGGHQHADRLSLVSFSQGQLLAIEKATPYNESVTRELGTLSPMHNTVTVDQVSQPQGESLRPDQVPQVAAFFSGSFLQYAAVQADRLYAGTQKYRRCVALVEDIIIDRFDVQGGSTHDWTLHHAGESPTLSIELTPVAFQPQQWLHGGEPRSQHAVSSESWSARWKTGAVSSSVWMRGAPTTDVSVLRTYPIDNATVTPTNPPCATLCVRRTRAAPFVAVHDAWRNERNVLAIAAATGGDGISIRTRDHTWRILFGRGDCRFENGDVLRSDAEFAIVRDETAAAFVSGTQLHVTLGGRTLRLTSDRSITLAAERRAQSVATELSGPIRYDTYGGHDHPRPVPDARVMVEGDLWPPAPASAPVTPGR